MIMAYLTLNNAKFKKHSGVKAYFFQELVKNGIIDKEYGKLYNLLYYFIFYIDFLLTKKTRKL